MRREYKGGCIMASGYHHLTLRQRIELETLYKTGKKVTEIAKYLGVHRWTVYRELRRGRYVHTNSDLTETVLYSSDLGQKVHDWYKSGKGRPEKIGNNIRLAEMIENKIIQNKYSPEAALAEIASENIFTSEELISLRTLYRYIDNGYFFYLTNKNLPVKGKKKRKNKTVRVQKRASAGKSIELRPEETDDRNNFGHWEMDTVKGKRGKTKSCLLVLTERKTRYEIIFKLPDQKAASVVGALDNLENIWKENFSNVFKTITVDNGVEFSDAEGMERSILHDGCRTEIFYCHPYSSYERGTNENNNKLVRRHIPKGIDIDPMSESDIAYIEKWINAYPRRMFAFKSSEELFKEELNRLGIATYLNKKQQMI